MMIPRIMATAVDVIVTTGALSFPNTSESPPIPLTKIADATKIFLVLDISICSLIIILTPEEAMNPYKRSETPPVTQVGMV